MPSKELLGDAIRTLTKKASRSFAARKDRVDAHHDLDDGQHAPEQDLVQTDNIDSSLSVRPDRSNTTVSFDKDHSTRSLRPSSSIDCLDADLAPPPSRGSQVQVTEGHILDLATANFPPIPEDVELQLLSKPVLIPRLNPGEAVPFARAWPSALISHAITKEDFIAFIDNLNVIIIPHAAFRVLQVAGFAVGLVPYDVAEGVGGALETIAMVGGMAVNYKRTKNYMARMNEQYFHPRRLHVKVIGTKRVKKLFGLGKKDPCLAPLTEETLNLTSQERCLQYMSQYMCELSFDVPAPRPAATTLAKITTWEVKHKILRADKTAVSGRKRSWKRYQKGKNPQTRWNSRTERARVRGLDWILIQNLEEWETQKAEKAKRKKQAPLWRNVA